MTFPVPDGKLPDGKVFVRQNTTKDVVAVITLKHG
jgi:hypothetical protein